MFLYNVARKINHKIKKYKKMRNGKILSPCRRIEFVYPPSDGRYVAMTFDDGPTILPTTTDASIGLTDKILSILSSFGAKGTFDVIGTTVNNYPDTPGSIGDFTWSGVTYDHYPQFDDDLSAGAVNQKELIKKIIDGGHEIASHTYSHTLFGPMRAVYKKRKHFNKLEEVVCDLRKLHNYMLEKFDYEIKLSRPPHYIDKIPDGATSYDAYRVMGYNYMAASFDGAGWQPLKTYEEEVLAMVNPLKEALSKDPDCLNGQIIFQKDGCNMNLRTPVCDGLMEQLKILSEYGYKVITVSELLEKSCFEDLCGTTEEMKYVKALLSKNHIIGYKNNTFAPQKNITAKEFMIMCADPEIFKKETALSYNQLSSIAKEYAKNNNFYIKNATGNALLEIAKKNNISIDDKKLKDKKRIKRIDALELIYALSEKMK